MEVRWKIKTKKAIRFQYITAIIGHQSDIRQIIWDIAKTICIHFGQTFDIVAEIGHVFVIRYIYCVKIPSEMYI